MIYWDREPLKPWHVKIYHSVGGLIGEAREKALTTVVILILHIL